MVTAARLSTDRTTTVREVTCVRCGCLCDDLVVHVKGGVATQFDNGCALVKGVGAAEAYPSLADDAATKNGPVLIRGRPVTLEEATDEAARILMAADFPWIDGIANTTVEAQRVLVNVARLSRGLLSGPPGASSFEAVLTSGMVSATLGEVKNRADLVVLWNCNPSVTHPRHFERYSIDAIGRWTPNGRTDRNVIALGANAPHDRADESMAIVEGRDFEAAWTLRAVLSGLSLDPHRVEQATGTPLERWMALAQTIRKARYAAILHDSSVHPLDTVEHVTRAIQDLVVALNHVTACVYIPLVGGGNPTGAEQITAWSTGFAGAVDFSSGRALPWRGEKTPRDILRTRCVDAALLIASDPMADALPDDWQWLGHIPTIVLSPRPTSTSASAAVSFRTAEIGRSVSGTVFRSDGVALPLRPWESCGHPSDFDVLEAIRRRMTELAR